MTPWKGGGDYIRWNVSTYWKTLKGIFQFWIQLWNLICLSLSVCLVLLGCKWESDEEMSCAICCCILFDTFPSRKERKETRGKGASLLMKKGKGFKVKWSRRMAAASASAAVVMSSDTLDWFRLLHTHTSLYIQVCTAVASSILTPPRTVAVLYIFRRRGNSTC